jgi:hypothetical protein
MEVFRNGRFIEFSHSASGMHGFCMLGPSWHRSATFAGERYDGVHKNQNALLHTGMPKYVYYSFRNPQKMVESFSKCLLHWVSPFRLPNTPYPWTHTLTHLGHADKGQLSFEKERDFTSETQVSRLIDLYPGVNFKLKFIRESAYLKTTFFFHCKFSTDPYLTGLRRYQNGYGISAILITTQPQHLRNIRKGTSPTNEVLVEDMTCGETRTSVFKLHPSTNSSSLPDDMIEGL